MGKVMDCFQGENLAALFKKNKSSGFELDASADADLKKQCFYSCNVLHTCSINQLTLAYHLNSKKVN